VASQELNSSSFRAGRHAESAKLFDTQSIPRAGGARLFSRLLTVADVAAALNVSTKTVRRLISSGRVESVRVGRSVRVSVEALERFLAGGREAQKGLQNRCGSNS
jgi:excisionase family DNA binding protein